MPDQDELTWQEVADNLIDRLFCWKTYLFVLILVFIIFLFVLDLVRLANA